MNTKAWLTGAVILGASLVVTTANAHIVNGPPPDTASTIDGIKVACAGVGEGNRAIRRWHDYAVRLEAVGGYGQFLGDENVAVSKPNGTEIAQFNCSAPWALMDLSPGKYRVAMSVPGSPARDLKVIAPPHGEKTIIVRFNSQLAGEPKHRMAENTTSPG